MEWKTFEGNIYMKMIEVVQDRIRQLHILFPL